MENINYELLVKGMVSDCNHLNIKDENIILTYNDKEICLEFTQSGLIVKEIITDNDSIQQKHWKRIFDSMFKGMIRTMISYRKKLYPDEITKQ